MWSLVNRLAALTWAIVFLAAGAVSAADDETEAREAELGRWAIALGLASGVTIADQSALSIPTGTVIVPPPGVNVTPPVPFSEPLEGTTQAISPYVGVNLEIMTPALDSLPMDPRAFISAEYLPSFAPQRTVALNGVATEFIIPQQTNISFPGSAISGGGTRVEAQVMNTVFSATIGGALAFEYRGRLLRIKPGAGWIRWGVISDARTLAAYKDDQDPIPNPPMFGENIRLVTLTGRGVAFFNAIGPSLELEMELKKRGQFRPVLYLTANAYRVVGNDEITYSAAASYDDALGQTNYQAVWTFNVEPWMYRAGLGFRFRWVGGD